MTDITYHLDPEQIEALIADLRRFHESFGARGALMDEEAEQRIVAGFRRFLESLFREQGDVAGELAREYFASGIPFALLMASLNHLKQQFVARVAENLPDLISVEHYARIAQLFEQVKSEIAHEYLVAEAGREEPMPVPALRHRILIRILVDWMHRVRSAIRDDLDRFPLTPARESEFARALRYPESMMICLDLKMCDQIEEQYRLIVRQAGILHSLLVDERYEQAYLAWQDLDQRVTQLLQLLSALYLEAQTNFIGRFFEFVQAALYLPGRKFLCVINLRRLDRINKLFGKEVGNRALECIESVLHEEFERHREWLLYTRGISGDFYLLGHDTDPGRMQDLLDRINGRACDRAVGGDLPVDLELNFLGVEITRIGELSTEDMHLVIQYLTERAREGGPVLETSGDSIDTMLSWLKERYRQAIDLRSRLTEESTDIFIQPLVTLDESREIHAFEVLGRFRGENGYQSAGLFIDDIISMGLAPLFDQLVLQAVIRHAPMLEKITPRLFINVSAASLAQPEYVDRLVEAVQGPLRGFEVVMELTEQVLLEHRDLVRTLHQEHGIAFAIDDFGTGYSTLQTVIELALEGSVSYLKVDGSLTRQLGVSEASERIMHITRQMAKELNLVTVVEFIETIMQAERLEALQMDLGQGYLLGVPDPVPVWQGKLTYLKSKTHLPGDAGFSF